MKIHLTIINYTTNNKNAYNELDELGMILLATNSEQSILCYGE